MIGPFRGKYRFLSNFWTVNIVVEGVQYPTVEHAFQAAKTHLASEKAWVRSADSPGQAKRRGRSLRLRPDWEEIKLSVMEYLLREKFEHPELAKQLLATGDEELVEVNHWGDMFWGVCSDVGENHLGKLLMQVRAELLERGV